MPNNTYSEKTFIKFIKTHKYIVLLTVIAALLRFWNLHNAFSFLGDQGRDAMIVADVFRKFDPVFIGPVTSVGNMYLGPLYYYFMLPFLYLTYPSPVGPAFAIAVLGTIYIPLLFILGKKIVGERAALFATILATFNTVLIEYSRFSWNPNPAPLLSLVIIFSLYNTYKDKLWYWVVVLVSWGMLIQLHYITLLMGAGIGIVWLHQLISSYRSKKKKRVFTIIKATTLSVVILMAMFSPLFAFDYKHDWLNVRAFGSLLSNSDNFAQVEEVSSTEKIITTINETHGRAMHMFFEVRIGETRKLNSFLIYSVVVFFIWYFWKKKREEHELGVRLLLVFAVTAILGLSAYQHSVFSHYILYLFPVTALLLGKIFDVIWSKKVYGKVLIALFFVLYAVRSDILRHLETPQWGVNDVRGVAQTIAERVKPGEKYNIVLLAESGDIDGQNYRYFLTTTETPPVVLEQRGEVDTLFIINEDRMLDRVVDSPIYEIVVFPNKEPAEVYQTFGGRGPEITVLRK